MHSGRTAPRAPLSSDVFTWANIALWLGLAAFIFRGYTFGTGDQAEQLPSVLRILDPNFLTRDWFVNSTQGFGPRTFYSYFMALPSHLIGIEAAFLLVHCLCWGFFAWGVAKVIQHLLRADEERPMRFFAAALVAWLFFAWRERVTGANSWMGVSLTPAELANTLGIWAIVFWLQGRWLVASLILLFAGGIHPLIGPLGGLTLALASWWSGRGVDGLDAPRKRPNLTAWLTLGSAIVIPLIAGYLGDRGGAVLTPEQKKQAISILAFERHPWHYVPWAWGTTRWMIWGYMLALGLWTRHKTGPIRLLDGFALVSIAFSLLGWVSLGWQPLWPLVKLQPFRMTIWLELAFFFYLAIFLARRLTSADITQRVSVALWLWVGIFALQNIASAQRLFFSVVLLALSELVLQSNKKQGVWVQLALLLLLMFLGRGGDLHLLLWLYAVPVVALLGGAWALSNDRVRPVATPASLLVAALLAIVVLAPLPHIDSMRRHLSPDFNYALPFTGPEKAVARWAKANTPPNALFLIPPQEDDFRLPAKRAIVVNFKTFAWGDQGLLDWRQRIADVTGNVPLKLGNNYYNEISDKYNALSPAQIVALQRKYKFDYAVVAAQKNLNWPLVFSEGGWKVYKAP